jgi:hypothetical protein
MSVSADAHLTCDRCDAEESVELGREQSPDQAVDEEGWRWTGTLLDVLICAECAEAEDKAEAAT